ncbi:MAG: extracellular solute-binding protein [Actinobacteria bacterium]|jgi:raffinose/stachyose/melibiose transport system substrate-binding protein|nr:extracellular solute-binding protein [Actinomycetota bacterium]
MNARAFKAVIAAVFAITASVVPLSQGFAAGETLGAKCTTEGYQTGTKSTSLICVKSAAGKLTWQRVKLNAGGRPVQNLTPPKGEIEFWHYRPEPGDQRAFVKIIADFEAKYPGTKIKQVFTDTTSFNATARVKILANPKAALFATSRGAVFDSFAKSDMMLDLSNQRYVKQNLITKGMLAGQYEGKQLGVPYQYLFNNPIVNTELWAKEKWTTPKNLSGWVAWCKDAKAKGYVPLAWPGATRGQAAQISNSALMNSAASYDDLAKNLADLNSGKIDLTSTWFKGVADVYVKLRNAGCFPDNATGVTEAAAYNLFATGKSPILPIGTFAMTSIIALNPALNGKMELMSMILTDGPVVAEGIMNNTFILSVNKNSSARDQQIANAFLSYLVTGKVAQIYANESLQHVNVLDVDYTNVNLLNTSSFQAKNTMLAPRFLLLNAAVSDLTQDALIQIVGGKSPDDVLPDFSKQIKQKLAA